MVLSIHTPKDDEIMQSGNQYKITIGINKSTTKIYYLVEIKLHIYNQSWEIILQISPSESRAVHTGCDKNHRGRGKHPSKLSKEKKPTYEK